MKVPDLKLVLQARKLYDDEKLAVDYYVRSILERWKAAEHYGGRAWQIYFPRKFEWDITEYGVIARWSDEEGYDCAVMPIDLLNDGAIDLFEDKKRSEHDREQLERAKREKCKRLGEYLRLKKEFGDGKDIYC